MPFFRLPHVARLIPKATHSATVVAKATSIFTLGGVAAATGCSLLSSTGGAPATARFSDTTVSPNALFGCRTRFHESRKASFRITIVWNDTNPPVGDNEARATSQVQFGFLFLQNILGIWGDSPP